MVEVKNLFESFVYFLLDSGVKIKIAFLKLRILDNDFSFERSEILWWGSKLQQWLGFAGAMLASMAKN